MSCESQRRCSKRRRGGWRKHAENAWGGCLWHTRLQSGVWAVRTILKEGRVFQLKFYDLMAVTAAHRLKLRFQLRRLRREPRTQLSERKIGGPAAPERKRRPRALESRKSR
jgi:hypothetical protein